MSSGRKLEIGIDPKLLTRMVLASYLHSSIELGSGVLKAGFQALDTEALRFQGSSARTLLNSSSRS